MNSGRTDKDSMRIFLNSVFRLNGEMIKGNGEDSFVCSVGDEMGLIGVFDGCGGIGSRKYDLYKNRTGAFVASRVAANIAADWFKEFSGISGVLSPSTASAFCDELKNRITYRLKELDGAVSSGVLKGSLAKNFPTTAAMTLFSRRQDELHCAFMWAGDSRGFVMTGKGLCQITRDDIDGGADALDNLSGDGKLNNVISAKGDFHINCRMLSVSGPAVLITATDGCFGYFSTPMEFEYMLVSTLENSADIAQWKQNMDMYIRRYAADDYTMSIAVYGYSCFKAMKKEFRARKMFLEKNFISRLKTANDIVRRDMWAEYRKGYYGNNHCRANGKMPF